MDATLTDKGREILAMRDGVNIRDLITQFSLFDDDINYKNVDFSIDPEDPNYPTFFTLEANPVEKASVHKSKLMTIPPGSAIWKKAFPDSENYSDGLRVIEATPPRADLTIDESITVSIKGQGFTKDTGEPIVDNNTSFIVYPKYEEDSQYIELSEVVQAEAVQTITSEDDVPEVL